MASSRQSRMKITAKILAEARRQVNGTKFNVKGIVAAPSRIPAAQKIRRLSNKSKVSDTYLYEVQSGGSYVVRFCVAQPGRITGTGWEPTSAPFTLCPPDGHFRPGLWRESGGCERSLPMASRCDNQYES